MSIKQLLIIVGLVIVFNGVLVFSGALDKLMETEKQTTVNNTLSPSVVDVFRFTLEEEVVKKIGQPIEGFEPQMFLAVFPGLVETDFEGVEASIGFYTIKEGRLVHNTEGAELMHSAAGAIGRRGMETLLNNVARRSGIDLQNDGTVTDIIGVITAN